MAEPSNSLYKLGAGAAGLDMTRRQQIQLDDSNLNQAVEPLKILSV